jgi:hypothetical protein
LFVMTEGLDVKAFAPERIVGMLVAVGVGWASSPAGMADAQSVDSAALSMDRDVIFWESPRGQEADAVEGLSSLTPEQMIESVPMPLRRSPPDVWAGMAADPEDAEDTDAPIRVIAPSMPDPAALPFEVELDQAALGRDGVLFQSESSDCAEPSDWGRMLDCYYQPWTETPASALAEHRASYPWKAIGKLFFHMADEPIDHYYHHCTAQVISGPPHNLLITAAHCVVDPDNGRPTKDHIFVPAYSNGTQPYGQFTARWTMASQKFFASGGEPRYDVALVSLENDRQGRPVSHYTGTLGLLMNGSYYQNIRAIGYSVTQVPDGAWSTQIMANTIPVFPTAKCPDLKRRDVLLMGSPMGPGSSGGAWISAFYPFDSSVLNRNLVTSVVSAGVQCRQGPFLTSPPNVVVGPRLSDGNIGLLCGKVRGGCGQQVTLRTLSVTVQGEGAIVSTPPGLKCVSDAETMRCQARFPERSRVTLSAIPERAGPAFVRWGGGCSGNQRECVLRMNENRSAVAVFR